VIKTKDVIHVSFFTQRCYSCVAFPSVVMPMCLFSLGDVIHVSFFQKSKISKVSRSRRRLKNHLLHKVQDRPKGRFVACFRPQIDLIAFVVCWNDEGRVGVGGFNAAPTICHPAICPAVREPVSLAWLRPLNASGFFVLKLYSPPEVAVLLRAFGRVFLVSGFWCACLRGSQP